MTIPAKPHETSEIVAHSWRARLRAGRGRHGAPSTSSGPQASRGGRPSTLTRGLLLAITVASAFSNAAETKTALPSTPVVAAPQRAWEFSADGVTIDSEFPSARVSSCSRLNPHEYLVVTNPENRPINPSPWFAFRIRSENFQPVTVRVKCEGGRLRYVPKISVDGRNWVALPSEAFTPGPSPEEGSMRLDVGREPLWVAAQEIVSVDMLESWSRTLERLPFVTRAEIGRSLGNRPMYQVLIDATKPTPPAKSGLVVVISRQHPPESTGSLSLMTFIETVLAETPRAVAFRRKFAVLLVPLVNPDGVELGHWRHNLNGVDTNRDWGTFAQQETRVVRDAIIAARDQRRHVLHLDFHSTHNDVFYTQPDSARSTPAGFTKAWLAGIEQRVPSYKVNRSATNNPTPTTSHNWAHRTFGIPTITYEVGDNTERTVLRAVAAAAADSMMEQLLTSDP